MRNLYRRRVRITILKENEEKEAHGWATTQTEGEAPKKYFFKADQPRFLQGVDNRFADVVCSHFENQGIYPDTITVKNQGFTYTFSDLARKRDGRRRRALPSMEQPSSSV